MSFCSKHLKQAMQPLNGRPPILMYSVLQPAASSGSSTFLSMISVFPPGLGLPFTAMAFTMVSFFVS